MRGREEDRSKRGGGEVGLTNFPLLKGGEGVVIKGSFETQEISFLYILILPPFRSTVGIVRSALILLPLYISKQHLYFKSSYSLYTSLVNS